MIELVRQRGTYDCGVAVAAMLAACPYIYVRELAEDVAISPRHGISALAMARLLTSLTGIHWGRRRPATLGVLGLARLSRFAALLAPADPTKAGHWVAIERGLVFDPEYRDPLPIKCYEPAIGKQLPFVVAKTSE